PPTPSPTIFRSTSAVLRQVRKPQPVWCSGSELALHEVRVDRSPGITVGDATETTPVDPEQSCRPHEPGHPLAGAPEPLAQPQLCMHPRHAIRPPAGLVCGLNARQEGSIELLPCGGAVPPPPVVA